MKVKYFYDGQVRRVLKHLIRLFGEFQVSAGFDNTTGEQKFKSVPCRYSDISRMTAYALTGGSENTMLTFPIITINIQSLMMNRQQIQAPVSTSSVVGINKTTAPNVYTEELEEIHHVKRFNPVPWDLTFNVNICTTSTTTKLELFEQICTLFNPSVQLQLNDNPFDWAALSDVELTDCTFSTRQFPQGQDSSDADVMILTFKTTVWLSIPATVEKAKLIEQIVTNIKTGSDEMDIELNKFNDVCTEVFTPRNLCIKSKLLSINDSSKQKYELTLVNKNMAEFDENNNILSWDLYMKYLKPNYDESIVGVKFLDEIEDETPILSELIEYGTEPNKIIVEADMSKYKVQYTIVGFLDNIIDFSNSSPTDRYVNISNSYLTVNGTKISPNDMFSIDNSVVNIIKPFTILDYVYCESDKLLYKYDELLGWHQAIHSNYRQGYWKLTFKD